MSLTGTVGAAAFALAWIPQCVETWRRRRCDVNASFLLLSAVGSLSLTAYAAANRDAVFTAVNALTSGGALLNLYMKAASRKRLQTHTSATPRQNMDFGSIGTFVATPELSLTEGESERP